MYLYENAALFTELIRRTAEFYQTDYKKIKKDYFMMLILNNVVISDSRVVFRGGTSLSKAYLIIKRFSEDTDLAFSDKILVSLSRHARDRKMYDAVQKGINNSGLHASNIDTTHSINRRNSMNSYRVNYGDNLIENALLPYVKIESQVFIAAFPNEIKIVQTYIGEYVSFYKTSFEKLMHDFPELNPFSVLCQRPERTLIDKMFALTDKQILLESYGNRSNRFRSRDLYDIYKIDNFLNESDYDYSQLPILFENVSKNPASKKNIGFYKLFMRAVKNIQLKQDFEIYTTQLLDKDESVSYDDLIEKISGLVNMKKFNFLKKA